MKNFLGGFAVGTLVLILLPLLFLRTGLVEVRSDVAPSRLISWFLDVATHASVRRHAPAEQSPFPAGDEQVLIAGGRLYLNDCIGCHGQPGKPSGFGASFYPPTPQFAQTQTRYSEAQIVWIAKHGIRRSGMGANGTGYFRSRILASGRVHPSTAGVAATRDRRCKGASRRVNNFSIASIGRQE